jgi:hypothetical protein
MNNSNSQEGLLRRKRAFADALAGVAASTLSLWLFYPIDVWKTNLQAGISHNNNMKEPFVQKSLIHRIPQYFAGFTTKTLHTASSSFLYFYLHSWILSYWKTKRSHPNNAPLSAPTMLALSSLAAIINTLITLPLDVISSREQASIQSLVEVLQDKDYYADNSEIIPNDNDDDVDEEEYTSVGYPDATDGSLTPKTVTMSLSDEDSSEEEKENVVPSLEVIPLTRKPDFAPPWRQRAWIKLQQLSSLWKGLTPSLLLCSNPAIHYTSFDLVKAYMLQRHRHTAKTQLTLSEAFVSGLLAKFIATMATYPLIRAKVLLMITTTCDETNMLQTLMTEYHQGGAAALYHGCGLQLVHTLLKSAFLMMTRERITHTTHRIILQRSIQVQLQ